MKEGVTHPIGTAIIGCGKISDFHIQAYKRDPRVTLRAVVDTDGKKARKTAYKYNVDSYYSDYNQVLEREDVQIVNVCVPNFLHGTVASDAILSGKNVLIEKPLTVTYEEGRNLVNLAKKHDAKLGVVHNKRYNTVTRQARAIIKKGELADVYMADYRLVLHGPNIGRKAGKWSFDQQKSGGGALMDLGIHVVDLIRWMLGEVSSVRAYTSSFFETIDADCLSSAILQMETGALCSMQVGWLSSYQEDAITIWGTAGTLIIEPWFSYIEVVRGPRNPVRRTAAVSKALIRTVLLYLSRTDETAESHYRLIRDFVSSVIEDKVPPVTGKEGLEAVRIVDALYRSAKTGKQAKVDSQ